ncbi:MAG: UDP-3-O-(3-hydroxymyristoyl)glucosamine N-acyltransferase [SAR324 cluster bacterium]|nr:UDP-3-O-(3-hydroxymyristoyl)glucosamine N-acyltransferase [SAR324 cluster bacterium]MBL7036021.1 UDP-3-O-(3-hydroxymyristoyl)glucosamine N-acyltransferase [SAR324 cluster bacterium]
MTAFSYSLMELAEKLELKYSGNGGLQITHVCGLDSLQPGGLAYLTSADGLASVPTPAGMSRPIGTTVDEINSSQVALLVSAEVEDPEHNLIYADDPLAAHVAATKLFHPESAKIPAGSGKSGIHSSAVVSKSTKIGRNVKIGPKVVIYDDVQIGKNSILHAGTVIMSKAVIGEDCIFYPNVVVQDRCEIGNRVILQSGAVIGSDGHGYFQREGVNRKIPQVGIVRLEDDVEIGACTTIDRARFRVTIIKQGSKLDNQVQIAHNVTLGEQALISAQTAVGGSVKAGHHLIMGGQSGIRDNVLLGNHVTAVARAVVTANTQDNEVLGGMPGRPVNQWRQLQSLINRLSELFERVRKLESRKDS